MSVQRLVLLILVGLLVLVGAGAWMYRAELTEYYYAEKQKREFAEAGVRTIQGTGLQGLEASTCESPDECTCIFLIHGMGDSSLTWRRLLTSTEKFPTQVRLLALDLPGMGKSPAAADPA